MIIILSRCEEPGEGRGRDFLPGLATCLLHCTLIARLALAMLDDGRP
jgi:hypothetical protein